MTPKSYQTSQSHDSMALIILDLSDLLCFMRRKWSQLVLQNNLHLIKRSVDYSRGMLNLWMDILLVASRIPRIDFPDVDPGTKPLTSSFSCYIKYWISCEKIFPLQLKRYYWAALRRGHDDIPLLMTMDSIQTRERCYGRLCSPAIHIS